VTPHASATTVVTAADCRYFRTLCQMLMSIERHHLTRTHAFTIVDLGIAGSERRELRARFPWAEVERFPFESYPVHVGRLATCAWKPIALADVLERRDGLVLWLDCATIVHGPLTSLFDRIARDGVFTLACQSRVDRWCHERTLRFMDVPAEDRAKRCRFGGVVGLDAECRDARELVRHWRDLALVADCIDPPGADRSNHRYDQAVLTNLLYAFERTRGLRLGPEEVDISSCNPVRWISTRNKVAPWLPLALDPVARAGYAVYKTLDRAALRLQRRFGDAVGRRRS